ncbi:MAG: hypothetical protein FWC06_01445 [Treponema sp.]|nr:hypothetical protein [Treponema sp.]
MVSFFNNAYESVQGEGNKPPEVIGNTIGELPFSDYGFGKGNITLDYAYYMLPIDIGTAVEILYNSWGLTQQTNSIQRGSAFAFNKAIDLKKLSLITGLLKKVIHQEYQTGGGREFHGISLVNEFVQIPVWNKAPLKTGINSRSKQNSLSLTARPRKSENSGFPI